MAVRAACALAQSLGPQIQIQIPSPAFRSCFGLVDLPFASCNRRNHSPHALCEALLAMQS